MESFNTTFTPEELQRFRHFMSLMIPTATTQNKTDVTVAVLKKEYLEFISKTLSTDYYRSVKLSLKHLTDYFGDHRNIGTITQKEFEEFFISVRITAPKGYFNYYRDLKAAFNKAVKWKFISENILNGITLPKLQKLNPEFITAEELRKIIINITSDEIRKIVLFTFYTGLRLREVVNLKFANVDLKTKRIIVGDKDFVTKGKKQRTIPLTEELYLLLSKKIDSQKKRTQSKYVFAKDNGHCYTTGHVSKMFKSACRTSGISEGIHFHSLRHSFASFLAQKDTSLYTIKDLLGHASVLTTEIYAHLNDKKLTEAINHFNAENTALAGTEGKV